MMFNPIRVIKDQLAKAENGSPEAVDWLRSYLIERVRECDADFVIAVVRADIESIQEKLRGVGDIEKKEK